MRPLAEIRERPDAETRPGTLRRGDLDSFGAVLDAVGGGTVLLTGDEGREDVSIGLAACAAARGRRTALVECDLAAPRLAGRLGLSEGPGLGEYLRVEAEAPQILQALVLAGPASQGAEEPLVCIVAGKRAEDAAAPVDSEAYRHALERLRAAYELVVLLGPPLDGALPQAAAGVDCVIACVSRPEASGRAGRMLARSLRELPAGRAELVVVG